jgi:hypothetical protein
MPLLLTLIDTAHEGMLRGYSGDAGPTGRRERLMGPPVPMECSTPVLGGAIPLLEGRGLRAEEGRSRYSGPTVSTARLSR